MANNYLHDRSFQLRYLLTNGVLVAYVGACALLFIVSAKSIILSSETMWGVWSGSSLPPEAVRGEFLRWLGGLSFSLLSLVMSQSGLAMWGGVHTIRYGESAQKVAHVLKLDMRKLAVSVAVGAVICVLGVIAQLLRPRFDATADARLAAGLAAGNVSWFLCAIGILLQAHVSPAALVAWEQGLFRTTSPTAPLNA